MGFRVGGQAGGRRADGRAASGRTHSESCFLYNIVF